MSVTIKDIAKLANVSHTTVSRALNNSPHIHEETKIKIKAIAKQLNYVPNYNAKSLVLNKTYNIALFFSTIDQGTSPSFFYEVVSGVNSVIRTNYNLVLRGISDYQDFLSVDKKRFDGIILISQSESDNVIIYDIMQKGIPLVVLNREIAEDSIVNILAAEKEGARKAVAYLIQNGHKDIALIEGKKGFKSSMDRKEGYIKALIEEGIQLNAEYIIEGEYNLESGHKAMQQLLALPKIPSAVFCSNDDMAVGAMKAIFEAGLNVPEDISVIGFDDSVVCNYVTPTLTTIKKSTAEISIQGAEKLLSILEGRQENGERIFLNTELVIRQSVANPK